jgi:hypothetical protein
VSPAELQRLKQVYGLSVNPSVSIAEFCAGIDYEPAPAPPPDILVKPVYTTQLARAPPPHDVVAALNRVAVAVDEHQVELFTDFRRGVVPILRFRNQTQNGLSITTKLQAVLTGPLFSLTSSLTVSRGLLAIEVRFVDCHKAAPDAHEGADTCSPNKRREPLLSLR